VVLWLLLQQLPELPLLKPPYEGWEDAGLADEARDEDELTDEMDDIANPSSRSTSMIAARHDERSSAMTSPQMEGASG
jgi:hypothetical protein